MNRDEVVGQLTFAAFVRGMAVGVLIGVAMSAAYVWITG